MKDVMTFVSTTKDPTETITMEIFSTSLPEVLGAFERFLRGSGFVFDGHLDIVDRVEIGGVDDGH